MFRFGSRTFWFAAFAFAFATACVLNPQPLPPDDDNGTDKIDPTAPKPKLGPMKIYAFALGAEGPGATVSLVMVGGKPVGLASFVGVAAAGPRVATPASSPEITGTAGLATADSGSRRTTPRTTTGAGNNGALVQGVTGDARAGDGVALA